MNDGWICLHRKILENPRFGNPAWLSVFLYLLLNASRKPMRAIFQGKPIDLKPGQLILGRNAISSKTGVPSASVWRLLEILKNDGVIEQQGGSKSSIFTVLNWRSYQNSEQQPSSSRAAAEQQNSKNRAADEQVEPIDSIAGCLHQPADVEQQPPEMNFQKVEKPSTVQQDNKVLIEGGVAIAPPPPPPIKPKKTRVKQEIPSLEEVFVYGTEKGFSRRACQGFFDFWSGWGWRRKGQTMTDWRRSLCYWVSNDKPERNGHSLPWQEIKQLEAELPRHQGNHLSTFHNPSAEQSIVDDFKSKSKRLTDLRAGII